MNYVLTLLFFTSTCIYAGDWPTWRCNQARQASSPDELPDDLNLHWVRELPKPLHAWPNEERLHFDVSYEPIVVGQRMFVGSTIDGRVTAYDTRTGAEEWKYYTNGPVRLAPAAWQDSVFVASDDGFLHAVDAATGKLLWKLPGAPETREQRYQLGNNRLISYWPVRGGPVIADGVVYFGAGIWPSMGTFVIAADAKTGKVIWRNTESNYLQNVRIDHNVLHESGVSPQGHFLVSGNRLLVTNGRSMPASFDRKTGKLEYFVQGYRRGDCRVTLSDQFIFVGFGGVLHLKDGREVGNRWLEAGKDAPDGWNGAKMDLFEGPLTPYKFIKACNYRSVIAGDMSYGIEKGVVYAYDLNRVKESFYDSKFAGRTLKPKKWELELDWKFSTPEAPKNPASYFIIKAGQSLFSHNAHQVFRLKLNTDGKPEKVTWSHAVEGTPSSLIAADDRFYVVTDSGKIYCFGTGKPETQTYDLAIAESPVQPANPQLQSILKTTNTTEGYAVVLGLKDGLLVKTLLNQPKLKVIAIDADPAKVSTLRSKFMREGLYGHRVELLHGDPVKMLLPPYLAHLIVSERELPPDIEWSRLLESLRPYGGTACFTRVNTGGEALDKLRSALVGAELPGASVQLHDKGTEKEFVSCSRKGALVDSAVWTHETGDAARSYFSQDQRVQAPLGVLWYGDGPDHGFYKRKDYGIGVKPQVVGGRLYAFQIISRTLHAIDVYTGRLLWKQKVASFTRYASMPDGIYVAGEDRCIVYDPTTGLKVRELMMDLGDIGERKPGVSDIRVSDDLVVVAVDFDKVRNLAKGLWNATVLVTFDRKTGKQLWRTTAERRFNINSIVVGGGHVYCIDSANPANAAEIQRRGEEPSTISRIMALDSRSGKIVWTVQKDGGKQAWGEGNWLGMRGRDDSLVYVEGQDVLLAGKNHAMFALNSKTGEELWRREKGLNAPLLVNGEQFLNQSGFVFETRTGKVLVDRPLITARGGCNYVVGNPNLLFHRDRSASYIDIKSGKKHYLRNLRTGCSNSMVAADGVLSVPCFSVGCICNYPLQTSFSMIHMPEVTDWSGTKAVDLRAMK